MDTSKTSIQLIAPNCDAETVYITGAFNEWITNSGVVELKKKVPGFYAGEAHWHKKPTQYKYHLGDWSSVERGAWGEQAPNRNFTGEGDIQDFVPQFLNKGAYWKSAFLPRIEELPSNLPLPVPFATRRIAALLPYNYEGGSKRYPVLYLQDGQNLFDEYAPYGNWELDKRLAWLAERGMGEFIVVAIDHAEKKRIAEYAPPTAERIQPGQADAYGHFLVKHLKPLIDRTYRTKADRNHTAIGGSSLGALASLHVVMTQFATFSKAMILSPSIWVDPDMVRAWPTHQLGDSHLFLYGGMKEKEGAIGTFAQLADSLTKINTKSRRIFVHHHFEPYSEHNESAWGRVFPRAAATLFK